MLANKSIVLGVTGGIAAYKVVEIARQLTRAGAAVDVIMTEAATKFVTPLTFQTLTQRPVITEMFKLLSEMNIGHVSLGERADLVVIAPATADIIAKLAHGICDDMLTTTVLATRAPVLVVPAMNVNMYENVVTQENIAILRRRGFQVMDPAVGVLASGISGRGRLPEIEDILKSIRLVLGRKGDFAGYRLVITAGGTQEPIDPVRYISNRSSGKMGHSLAEAALDRGASVTLITTSSLKPPYGCEVIPVETAFEMRDAVVAATQKADALIMAAAVADYRVENPSELKMKKEADKLTLNLVRNPDILGELSNNEGRLVKVGFAAESHDLLEHAKQKLAAKNLDMIVANQIIGPNSAFGNDDNKVWILAPGGHVSELPMMRKLEAADRILDRVLQLINSRIAVE
jgi:phosphopantothenoylcysteine decarboxylase/phosphopantothenate--cysteine ligase